MIQAVFVIRNGLCLFSRQYGEKVLDSDLVSGFLGAINAYTESISNGLALEVITMNKTTLSFTIIDELLFVFKHGNMKDSKLKKIVQKFTSNFISSYKSELKDWEGDTSLFDDFEGFADKILINKDVDTPQRIESFFAF